ncbi:hypothetical protein ETB97_001844 [Aspergillus alliaceus]|uniref:Zn(2)-C6 fungal-type domain-containing protein n=1 Tax=Petromyces alliaceus TaxID=209559 RepID=A0A8H6A1K8_PETAA|nr:hypothetical protein ETB97_001844 [Aspergillus burnettii]
MDVSDAAQMPLFEKKTSGGLRLACNSCHKAKVRCSGGYPCKNIIECQYSYAAKVGKSKGSRNKRTLAKLKTKAVVVTSKNISNNEQPVASEPEENTNKMAFDADSPATAIYSLPP